MSTSQQSVTLLDLPSRSPCKTWSLNPWKTRLFLNYKKIPYTTQWTVYPDIPDKISAHVEPHPEGTAMKPYTIPAVILPDGTYLQESLAIAKKLDELYPDPELKIQTPVLEQVLELVKKITPTAAPEYMARIPERLLVQRDEEYWYSDRAKRVGMPVKEFETNRGGQQVTDAVSEPVRAVGQLLGKNGGPFFEGEQVTYADFVWVAFLLFLERIGQDAFDTVIGKDKDTHVKLLQEVKRREWTERDDH